MKKTTKKTVHAKAPAGKAPVAATMPAAPTCGCGCHGGHFWKKLIILIIVFAAGFAVCKCTCHHKGFEGKRMNKATFVDGCLDLSKINRPAMVEKMLQADLDGDGCITKEELKVFWKEKRGMADSDTEIEE
ncbi:MAG: hypothetical protein FWF97_02415 [Alphaproteobacteria bacterium]|nr:hypothetical protein [Alphaproteobacteria bacterium]